MDLADTVQAGRTNILVIGRTGAGKSTLLNTVFGSNVAKAGRGRPMPHNFEHYLLPWGNVGIYDSRGVELGETTDNARAFVDELIARKWDQEADLRVSVVWLVYRIPPPRVQPEDVELIRALRNLGLTVMVVITNVSRLEGAMHAADQEEIEAAQRLVTSQTAAFVVTNSVATAETPEIFGHTDLIDSTIAILPDAQQDALVTGQVINRARKAELAKKLTTVATAKAFGAAAQPVPLLDDVMLARLATNLIQDIAEVYHIEPQRILPAVHTLLERAGLVSRAKKVVNGALTAEAIAGAAPGAANQLGKTLAAKFPALGRLGAKGAMPIAIATALAAGVVAGATLRAIGKTMAVVGARNLVNEYPTEADFVGDLQSLYKDPDADEFEQARRDLMELQSDQSSSSGGGEVDGAGALDAPSDSSEAQDVPEQRSQVEEGQDSANEAVQEAGNERPLDESGAG